MISILHFRDEIAVLAQEYEETPLHFSRLEGLDSVLRQDSLSTDDVWIDLPALHAPH